MHLGAVESRGVVGLGDVFVDVVQVVGVSSPGLNVVSLPDGVELRHGSVGEVAAGDDPLVVLVGEDGADEA